MRDEDKANNETSGPAAPGSDRSVVIRGSVWMGLSAILSRTASFAAQIVLGWLLSKEDFAVYAIAISVGTILTVLKNGGAQQMLIRQGSKYQDVASVFWKFALAFNLLAMALLLAIGPAISSIYQDERLGILLMIIAISLPLGTPAMLFRVRLAIDRRFGSLAKLEAISNLTRQGSMIIFALIGFGPMSFVLPIVLVAVVDSWIGARYVRSWPPNRALSLTKARSIFHDAKWVMLGSFALGIATQGDFLIIGLFENMQEVGVYFFGYQLVFTIIGLLHTSINSILPPTLARFLDDKERLKGEFLFALKGVMFVAMPIAIGMVILSESIIHLVWNGKWDDSIPVVQIIALTLPFSLLVTIVVSFLEANGLWRLRLAMVAGYGVGGMAFAGFGAWLGGVVEIAIAVCVFRVLYPVVQILFTAKIVGISIRSVLSCIVLPMIYGAIAVFFGITLVDQIIVVDGVYMRDFATFIVFVGVYAALVFLYKLRNYPASGAPGGA